MPLKTKQNQTES